MLQFEYINPLAGLAMLVIGLFVVSFGYIFYGMPLVIVGLVFIVYYRKYLMEILGV
jgi:hypothetical protein